MRPLVDMQRPVDTVGARGTAAFTVARLEPGEMPEGRIQLLTHRTEQMVWQPRWLAHPNGAIGLTSVIIAVGDLERSGATLRASHRPPRTSILPRLSPSISTAGAWNLVTASTFAQMCPQIPIPSLPFIGAYGIEVGSLEIAERILQAGRARDAPAGGRSLIAAFPKELGCGAWMFSGPNAASAGPR